MLKKAKNKILYELYKYYTVILLLILNITDGNCLKRSPQKNIHERLANKISSVIVNITRSNIEIPKNTKQTFIFKFKVSRFYTPF